ncbi:hypothetical protein GUJ93_ZPchr0012g19189 [Zizania palustris]|uniref:Uncharacterized protein n=1 Tax=Zizania palustris TaxID=103762 RepID=A0A8J5WQ60_ZIZPA|nr:hypothetical protein GUJ93_ZPchr0012g19189 [Zizania palustris]
MPTARAAPHRLPPPAATSRRHRPTGPARAPSVPHRLPTASDRRLPPPPATARSRTPPPAASHADRPRRRPARSRPPPCAQRRFAHRPPTSR